MIIDSSTDCYAKNSFGEIIDISVDECKDLSVKNTRMYFSKVKKEHLLLNESANNGNNNIEYTPATYPKL